MSWKFWSGGKEDREEDDSAVFIHDMKGMILEANQKAVEIFGYSREELLKLNALDLGVPEDRGRAANALKEIILKGKISFVGRYKTKNGEVGEARVSSQVIEREGVKAVRVIFVKK